MRAVVTAVMAVMGWVGSRGWESGAASEGGRVVGFVLEAEGFS